MLDRFLREIRAVAKLRHPNIVTAYSATRLGESIVFAMEYVEGLDLSKMVKAKGPLPVAHACNFVYQAALGLQHAHEEGLVHRDIKPGNLMLSRKGDKATIKMLDFGLAKATREEKVDGGLTSEGQALGTPDYHRPRTDHRRPECRHPGRHLQPGRHALLPVDRPPAVPGEVALRHFQAHISRDADPLNFVRPEVPAELAALVAKMMAKDPARRFQTPGEVAEALTPFFKKANVAFKARRRKFPRPVRRRRAVRGPGQFRADSTGDGCRRKVCPGHERGWDVRRRVAWESLIDFRKTNARRTTPRTVDRGQRPPWKKWSIIRSLAVRLGRVGCHPHHDQRQECARPRLLCPMTRQSCTRALVRMSRLNLPVNGQEATGGTSGPDLSLRGRLEIHPSTKPSVAACRWRIEASLRSCLSSMERPWSDGKRTLSARANWGGSLTGLGSSRPRATAALTSVRGDYRDFHLRAEGA